MPTAPIATPSEPAGKPFPSFMGSKDASGLTQQITSRFPPHHTYVELFLGGGAVLRAKRPALCSIAIESDADVAARWRAACWPGLQLIEDDALSWITANTFKLDAGVLLYADPPYMHSTRTSRRRYRCELTDEEHATLLTLLEQTACSVFISGYDSDLYRERLRGWHHASFPAMTRGGLRQEHLWWRSSIAGYSDDARSAGRNFRERERMKRRRARWRANFEAMQPPERAALLAALIDAHSSSLATSGDRIR